MYYTLLLALDLESSRLSLWYPKLGLAQLEESHFYEQLFLRIANVVDTIYVVRLCN